jgi:NADH-quinone oxidoreductase subunit M
MTALASAGVPGFANFIGEMMILLGAWDRYRLQTVFAVAGLIVTAGYMLKMVRATLQGPLNPKGASLKDARGLERFPYLLLIAVLLLTGFLPQLLLPTIAAGTRAVFGAVS